MSAVTLRSYKDRDYNAVTSILKEGRLFSKHLDYRESLRNKIRTFPGSIIVASTPKQIVGCVYVLREAHSISHLTVKKKFRKKGIATMLLNAAEEYLISNNISEWTLFALNDRADLHDYYTNRGYQKGNEFVIFTKKGR